MATPETMISKIGFNSQGAITELNTLETALGKYAKTVTDAALAMRSFNTAAGKSNSSAVTAQMKQQALNIKEQAVQIKQQLAQHKIAMDLARQTQSRQAQEQKNADQLLKIAVTYSKISQRVAALKSNKVDVSDLERQMSYVGVMTDPRSLLKQITEGVKSKEKAYAASEALDRKNAASAASATKADQRRATAAAAAQQALLMSMGNRGLTLASMTPKKWNMLQQMFPPQEFAEIRQQLLTTGATFGKFSDKAQETANGVLLSWQSVVRIFAIQTIHRAISEIMAAFADGVRSATDFQIRLGEVQTISASFGANLGVLTSQVRALSEAYGEPLESVTEGVYQQLSNQVGDASNSLQFMKSALDLSTTAVMSSDSAVNLLSSAINSFGLSISSTDTLAGKFFKTIELGRVRGEEMADTIGRILPLSAQLGVSFDETLASIAALTVTGMKYNEAFTLISNTQLGLIKPTEELKKVFARLNVVSGDAGIAMYGYHGFLRKIREETSGTTSETAKLFGRIRGIRGVLGLVGTDESKRYLDYLEQIQKAGSADIKTARQFIFETNAKEVIIEMTKLRNFFVVDLGQGFLAVANDLFKFVGGAKTLFADLAVSAGLAATAFAVIKVQATAAAAGISAVSLATKILTSSSMLAFGNMVLVFTGATAALMAYQAMTKSTKKSVDELNDELIRQNKTREAGAEARVQAQNNALNQVIRSEMDYLKGSMERYKTDKQFGEAMWEVATDDFKSQLDERIGAYETFVKKLNNASYAAKKTIREADLAILDIGIGIGEFRTDRFVIGMDAARAAVVRLNRAEELRSGFAHALYIGDLESAKTWNQRSLAAAQTALSAADESKNINLIRAAEYQVVQAMYEQMSIQEAIQKREEERVRIAEAIKEEENASLAYIKTRMLVISKAKLDFFGEKKDFDESKAIMLKAANEIADELGRVGARNNFSAKLFDVDAGFGEFTDMVSKLQEPMRNAFTGKMAIDMSPAIEASINAVKSYLEQWFDALPKAIQDAFKTQMGDKQKAVFEPGDLQNQLTELKKASTESIEAQGKLNEKLVATKNTARSAQEALTSALAEGEKLTAAQTIMMGKGPLTLPAVAPELAGPFDTVKKSFDILNAEIGKGIPNLEVYRAALAAMGEAAMAISEAGYSGIASSIQGSILSPYSKELLTAVPAITDAKTKIEDLGTHILGASSEMLKLPANAEIGFGNVKISVDTATQAIRAYNENLRAANELLRSLQMQQIRTLSPGQTIDKFWGGPLYRSNGGSAARGQDRVPVMAQAGEFFVNARQSQRFATQLVAMNAGVVPNYRFQGGQVTNVGDVSINIQGNSSPKQTAREVMAAFNRETRRGTSSIK